MIISRTPLRISFFGGGTDFPEFFMEHGGMVLSTAIKKYAYVSVRKERFYGKTILNYMKKETVDNINDIENTRVRECMKAVQIDFPVEISLQSDVPSSGTGLGASSAFLVGTINALWYAKFGHHLNKYDLGKMACDIEVGTLKEPIGFQDQFATAFGGANVITFDKTGVSVSPVKTSTQHLRKLESQLLAFYTNKGRNAADILTEQKKKVSFNTNTLKEMKAHVAKGELLLQQGRLDDFGALLHEAWLLKKSLASGVSDPEIDLWYQKARELGAWGGKIAGAGGGGFLLLHVPQGAQPQVRKAMQDFGLRELPLAFEPEGSKLFHIGEEQV